MTKTAYVNVRIDRKTKSAAEKVFRAVGINASDALSMFYRQTIIAQGLPFEVVCNRSHTPNKKTRKALRDLDTGKGHVFTGSTKDLLDALDK